MSLYGTVIPHVVVMYEGSSTQFMCISTTLPIWCKNQMPLLLGAQIQQMFNVLVLTNVTDKNSGTYTCTGTVQNNSSFLGNIELRVGG